MRARKQLKDKKRARTRLDQKSQLNRRAAANHIMIFCLREWQFCSQVIDGSGKFFCLRAFAINAVRDSMRARKSTISEPKKLSVRATINVHDACSERDRLFMRQTRPSPRNASALSSLYLRTKIKACYSSRLIAVKTADVSACHTITIFQLVEKCV